MHALISCLRVAAVILAYVAAPLAQTAPLSRSADSLRPLTRAAGIIFRGTVVSIRKVPLTRPDQLETIEITFRVDEAFRGTKTGTTLRIREWAGLWTSDDRYRVGQKLALFLYAPSRLGLTSPAGGDAGRLAIDDDRQIHLHVTQPARALTPGSVMRQPRHDPLTLSPREFRSALRRATQE